MNSLNLDSQIGAFRRLVEMENRGQQLDELFARMRQTLLQGSGEISLPDAVGSLDQVRWTLDQLTETANQLESELGIQRGSVSASQEQEAKNDNLRGSSTIIPIPDIVSLLGNQRSTGTLRIVSKHGERFVLEFLDGAVVHVASDTPLPSQLLGSILVAQNKLSHERLTEFVANLGPLDDKIGKAMTDAELVDREDLLDALETQVRRIFQRVFALKDATYCFTGGAVSDFELRVTMNTTQLLLDAARNYDEENRTKVAR